MIEIIEEGKCGDEITWTLWEENNERTLIISGRGNMWNCPGGIAFDHRDSISKVTIYNGVTSIGSHAFYRFSRLRCITIPNSVTIIEIFAFSHCTALTHVNIPPSVTRIGKGVFHECKSIKEIILPDSVISLSHCYDYLRYADCDTGTFEGCSALEHIHIPHNLDTIPTHLFKNCLSLKDITIPDSVTSIGCGAFEGCNLKNNINIDARNKTFYKKNKCIIYKIYTDTNDPEYDPEFDPEIKTETVIYGYEDSIIPYGVTGITNGAFAGCEELKSIEIPNSVTYIGNYAFENCKALTTIEIPNSVTTIGMGAFSGCTALTTAEIPNSVTDIWDCAFENCDIYITVAEDNPKYKSIDGFLVTKDEKILLSSHSKDNICNVPEGICILERYAITIKVSDVFLPKTIKEIEPNAFCGAEIERLHMKCEHPECLLIRCERDDNDWEIDQCALHVPIGTGYAYRHHPYFSEFKEVVIDK